MRSFTLFWATALSLSSTVCAATAPSLSSADSARINSLFQSEADVVDVSEGDFIGSGSLVDPDQPDTAQVPKTREELYANGAGALASAQFLRPQSTGTARVKQRRDIEDLLYFSASRNAMNASTGQAQYSVEIREAWLTPFLEAAAAYGKQQFAAGKKLGAGEAGNYFRFSKGPLQLVAISSGAAAVGKEVYNWGDYGSTAGFLKEINDKHAGNNKTWIGTVSDSKGTAYVDFAIYPTCGVSTTDNSNRSLINLIDDGVDEPNSLNNGNRRLRRAVFDSLPERVVQQTHALEKRTFRHPIGNSGFKMTIRRGSDVIVASMLFFLASQATIMLRDDAPGATYTHLSSRPTSFTADLAPGSAFEIMAAPNYQFQQEMLSTMTQMLTNFVFRAGANVFSQAKLKGYYGEITDAQGNLAGIFNLGGQILTQQAVMKGLGCTVKGSTPAQIYGCLVKDEL